MKQSTLVVFPNVWSRWLRGTAGRLLFMLCAVTVVLGVTTSSALAQEEDGEAAMPLNPDLAPPSAIEVADHPWDAGEVIEVSWTASPSDNESGDVISYRIERRALPDGEWREADVVDAGTTYDEVQELQHGQEYEFRLAAIAVDGSRSEWATSQAIAPSMQIFLGDRFWLSILLIIFCGSVVFWIFHARSGKPIKVRKIGGLEAVDEAVGRATEMGRSCLYVPGIQDINEIQTIASMTMLSRVAKTAAEYDAKVEVPTARSLVMTTARETVQAAYLSAGRPDAYNQDLIYYVTDEQFGYVAYLQGMMVREKPAACFYMGAFFAESLILAETGNSIGAIQVAGTAMPAQLPFFVAACDYTLIGEEFFAASAYLSGSPEELGSLKGQDVGKVIVAALVVIGVALYTLATITGSEFILDWVFFIKDTVLA